ncbi:hypothetical protein HDU78_005768 [Chytriomyces hyalinus]|nr:hypothetical protein HDU78_005768 [Chytriomyces hyalinus]
MSSLTVLMMWLTEYPNYSRYKGAGKTGENKESLYVENEVQIHHRDANVISLKIQELESSFKDAKDWLAQTGQGIMDEEGDGEETEQNISLYIKKKCPFYNQLEPIMGERASTQPLATNKMPGSTSTAALRNSSTGDMFSSAHTVNDPDSVGGLSAVSPFESDNDNPFDIDGSSSGPITPLERAPYSASNSTADTSTSSSSILLDTKKGKERFSYSAAKSAKRKVSALDMWDSVELSTQETDQRRLQLEREKFEYEKEQAKVKLEYEKEQAMIMREKVAAEVGIVTAEAEKVAAEAEEAKSNASIACINALMRKVEAQEKLKEAGMHLEEIEAFFQGERC